MPTRYAAPLLLAIVTSVGCKGDAGASDEAAGPLVPAEVVPKELPAIYAENADMKVALDGATKQAKAEGRHVLVVIGGNWCTWCHKLHMLFERHDAIAKRLATSFVVVNVDSNRNEPLITELGIEIEGVPFLAVLDGAGTVLVRQASGSLEKGPRHDPTRVLAFLDKWAPAS